MNLTTKTREDMAKIKARTKTGSNIALIEEFMNMGVYAVEVENYAHKTPYSCATALRQTCEAMNVGCKATVIDHKVYLINEGVK